MHSYSLDEYGLDGCYSITSNVYSVPEWDCLHTLVQIRSSQYMISPPIQTSETMYEIGSILATGTYGKVYHAKRSCSEETRNIVIKEHETDSPTSYTLHEAILHAIVHKTFTDIGLGCVIPALYEVTTRNDSAVCMAMEWVPGSTLLHYFHIYLTRISNSVITPSLPDSLEHARSKNDSLLLDILVQVAIYLTILQKKLQFMHRDLKINNVLLRHTSARSRSVLRRLDHPLLDKPWECRHDVVVIDFGFSCMKGQSTFEAGFFFKSYPPSVNHGRDLALFLYSIHAFFPLNHYVSPTLWAFLQSCMLVHVDGTPISLFQGIQTNGTPCVPGSSVPFDKGIYHFLQKDSIDLSACDPSVFLKNVNNIL